MAALAARRDRRCRAERRLAGGVLRHDDRRETSMRTRLRAIGAVALLAVLDGLRRKDLYVMGILCGLIVAAGRLFAAFGVWGLETFIKDLTFTTVSGCSVLLCIMLAARQVPE